MTRRKTNAIILTTGAIIVVILFSFVLFDNTKQSSQAKISPVVSKPTSSAGKLTSEQRAQIVAIITTNTNHYKKIWLDGQNALNKTNSSDFSTYMQTENPASDNSMNDAFKQADAIYPSNVSDDSLSTWRMDMIQLSSDMGIWVSDGARWQIKTVAKDKLNADAQTVNQGLSTVEKDIQTIN